MKTETSNADKTLVENLVKNRVKTSKVMILLK